jgi:hypothetical protein
MLWAWHKPVSAISQQADAAKICRPRIACVSAILQSPYGPGSRRLNIAFCARAVKSGGLQRSRRKSPCAVQSLLDSTTQGSK